MTPSRSPSPSRGEPSPDPRAGQTPNVMTLLGVGTGFGICVGLGVFLGVLADHAFGTSPILALVGVVVGLVAGGVAAYQVIRPYTRPR